MADDGEGAQREVSRLPTDAEFAAESAKLDAEVVKLAELRADVAKLFPAPNAAPTRLQTVTRVVNRVEGAADQLVRIVIAFVMVAVALIALAIWVSPWFWVGVGIWVAYGAATVLWLLLSQRKNRRRAIAGPPIVTIRPGR